MAVTTHQPPHAADHPATRGPSHPHDGAMAPSTFSHPHTHAAPTPGHMRARVVSNASSTTSHSSSASTFSSASSTLSANNPSSHPTYSNSRPRINSLHLAGGSTSPSALPATYNTTIEPPHMPSLFSYGGGNNGAAAPSRSPSPLPYAAYGAASGGHSHSPERDANGHISVASWLANRRMSTYEKLFGSCGLETIEDIATCSPEMESDLLSQVRKPGYRLKLRVLINDLRHGHGTGGCAFDAFSVL